MENMLDIFQGDPFSVTTLTTAINKVNPVPTQLGDSGLFPAGKGVTTTTVAIEMQEGRTRLIQPTPRGAPPSVSDRKTRKTRALSIPHFPRQDVVRADEVQNVRAFGTVSTAQAVADLVVDRLAQLKADLEYTMEDARMRALKGVVFDENGNDIDLYQFFGVTRQSLTMNFGAANFDLRGRLFDLVKALKANDLKGVNSGGTVFCGDDFWQALITSKAVHSTYLNTQAAADLRGEPTQSLYYAGVKFVWYDGSDEVKIDADSGIFVPKIHGMFETYHAPAPYIETVNTLGLAYYARQRVNEEQTGVNLTVQTNTLVMNTCPQGVVDLKLA